MLTYAQIKRMTKPYSDRQMLGKDSKLVQGQGWWSNGFVLFLESEPKGKSAKCEVAEGTKQNLESLTCRAKNVTQAWPVEIRAYNIAQVKALVRFASRDGTDLWVNARYAGAILKRHKDATFFTNGEILEARDGKAFAYLMPIHKPDVSGTPDWELRNMEPLGESDEEEQKTVTKKYDNLDLSNLDAITEALASMRQESESLDMVKAELFSVVKEDKLYKADFGTFARYCDSVGYHRVTVYHLIRCYNCSAVNQAYAELGQMRAMAIAKSDKVLDADAIAELVEFATQDGVSAREVLAKVKEEKALVQSADNPKEEKAPTLKNLLETKTALMSRRDLLKAQLSEVESELAELEAEILKLAQ